MSGNARSLPVALVVSMRPRQWMKNVLVFAAPLAAGELFARGVLLPSLGAFVAFCLLSSATYLVNDMRDIALDREHPTKKFRPIPAGELPIPVAIAAAAILTLGAFALAAAINLSLAGILVAYLVVTLSYSFGLKNEPVIELGLLAMGFLLRAVAGGAASDLPISTWFLIVTGFGSLFMAAGKRSSELARASIPDANGQLPATRRSLQGYSTSYLRFVWATSAAVTITAYCLWAFEVASHPSTVPWAAWSVLPFVLAILRYGVDVDRGSAEAPEDVVLKDRALIALGIIWLVLFGLGALGV
jgi:decaprenyl-phosphate phosphoribosyltransferase